eukprot:338100-Amphidinium_carterae.4
MGRLVGLERDGTQNNHVECPTPQSIILKFTCSTFLQNGTTTVLHRGGRVAYFHTCSLPYLSLLGCIVDPLVWSMTWMVVLAAKV